MSQNITINDKYFENLVKRIFRVLPMLEAEDATVERYVNSLTIELCGLVTMIEGSEERKSKLITVASTLRYIQYNYSEIEHSVYKREIFKCIRLIKDM